MSRITAQLKTKRLENKANTPLPICLVNMNEPRKHAIFQVLQRIPAGKVATYGQIAQLAGLGKAARYVGTTLKNLPASTQLPWHRVVNSQGRISLPANQPGHLVQKERLAQEGVIFVHGKINLKQFLWQL